MAKVKIQSGVEKPVIKRGRPSKYEFGSLRVGDSFAVPIPLRNTEKRNDVRNRIASAASSYGKRNSMRFSVKVLPAEIRVWRDS